MFSRHICVCGNSPGEQAVNSSLCELKCAGNQDDSCGNVWSENGARYVSIYATGV